MKKLLFLAVLTILGLTKAHAQDSTMQTQEGNWMIEINTNFGVFNGNLGMPYNTGISFTRVDGNSVYSVGGEVGYFVIDNLAVKVGLGYSGESYSGGGSEGTFIYKIGAKYYIGGVVPVGIDYTGASVKHINENPSYLGLQIGYAIFLSEHISLEPGIRYNISLNEDFSDENVFEVNVGFVVFFN